MANYVVPSSAAELNKYMRELFENRKHVNSVKLDPTKLAIHVDLSRTANMFGKADFDIPIRSNQMMEAEEVVQMLVGLMAAGRPPSDAIGERLFNIIDTRKGIGS